MNIENNKLDEYEAELANAIRQLKNYLADSQNVIGVAESFLYLIKKELKKPIPLVPSENGKEG